MIHAASFDIILTAVAPAMPANFGDRLPIYEALETAAAALAVVADESDQPALIAQRARLSSIASAIRAVDELQLQLFGSEPKRPEGL